MGLMMEPDPRPPVRHPRPPHVYPTPSGWRATCRACGWEHGHYADRHDALGGFLDHAELEHGVIVREQDTS